MHILHISNDYFNSKVYQTLHQGLQALGVRSSVFVPMKVQDSPHNLENIHEAHCFQSFDRFLYMNKQRKVYKHLRPVLQKQHPDLLHGYFLYSAGISCLWAKEEFGTPYVITVQNTDVNTMYRWFIHLRGLARKILREASMVFFVSNAYRQFVLQNLVSPNERDCMAAKFRLVPFATDPFWTNNLYSRPSNLSNKPFRIATVGIVNHSKNQQTAVDAIELLRKRGNDISLTVVGASTDPKLEKQLCSHDFVRRVYHLPKEQLMAEYRQADLFLLPSIAESFGLVYAEALSQGIPVLYSAGQGFDEQFSEGYIGYRVAARSAEDIAKKIQQVISNYPDLQKNCTTAAQRFSRETVCREVLSLYEEILSHESVCIQTSDNAKE